MSKARQLIEGGESRVIPGYDPLSLNHHLITDAVINALQHLRNVKATVEFGETAYQGNYTQLLLLASQAYGFDVADMAVAFNRIHKEFVKLAAGKHVWAVNRTGTAVRSGYVFIITDDSFDKVERKLAAADAGSMDESVVEAKAHPDKDRTNCAFFHKYGPWTGYDPRRDRSVHVPTELTITLDQLEEHGIKVEFGALEHPRLTVEEMAHRATKAYGDDFVFAQSYSVNQSIPEGRLGSGPRHVWAVSRSGIPSAGYTFIFTDDSFDKVARKITAAAVSPTNESTLVEAMQDWTDWGSPPPDTGQAAARFRSRIARVAPSTKMLFATAGVADWAARLPFVQALAALYPDRVLDSEYSFGVAQLDFLEGMLKKFEPKQVVFLFMDKFAYDTTVVVTDDSLEKIHRKVEAHLSKLESTRQSTLVEAIPTWSDWGIPPPGVGRIASRLMAVVRGVSPDAKLLFATTGVADWSERLPFVQALSALYPGRVLDSEYSFGTPQLDFLEGMLRKFKPAQVVFLFMDKFAYDTTAVVTDDSLEKIHRKVEAYQSKLESIQPVAEDMDGWKTTADGWVQFYNNVRPILPSGTWRAIETAVIAAMGGKHDKSSLSIKENPEAHLVFVRCGSQLFNFINTTRYYESTVVVSDQDVTTNWLRNLFDLNVSKLPAGTAKYVYAFMTSTGLRTVKIVFTDDPPDKVQRTIMAAKVVREGSGPAERVVEEVESWKTSASGWSDFYKRVAPVISTGAALAVKEAVYAAGGGDVESEPPDTFNPKSQLEFIRTDALAHEEFKSLLDTKYKDSAIFVTAGDAAALDAAALDVRPKYAYDRDIARRFAVGVRNAGGPTQYTYVIMLGAARFAMVVVFTNDSPDKFRRTVAAAEVVAEALSR